MFQEQAYTQLAVSSRWLTRVHQGRTLLLFVLLTALALL